MKSTETNFSYVTSKILFNSLFEANSNSLFIFFILISFFVQKTNSTRETFGVGTLIATPSNFPFKLGIISPIAFDAPVDVGTIDWLADRALLGSL